MSRPAAAAALAVALAGGAGCGESPKQIGPPRCEPAEEMELARTLKQGYRHLLEGDRSDARAAFREVLDRAPDHPEATAALRRFPELASAAERAGRSRPAGGEAERGTTGRTAPVRLDGRPLRSPPTVDARSLRFEEWRRQHRLAREMGLSLDEAPTAPLPRRDGATEGARAGERIELAVLHDAPEPSVRASFVRLAARGRATHFLIGPEGRIVQTLDLARVASHTGRRALDGRSVAIHLVRRRPELGDGPAIEAAGRLVAGLARELPALPAELPGRDRVPRGTLPDAGGVFRGVVGHLHVDTSAGDPRAPFDWGALRRTLR